jgi:hypothetical protein
MEDKHVSPGLFAGAMGLVVVSIVKDPSSIFNLIWARLSAKLDAFAIFMVGLLKIGLIIAAIGLVFWIIVRIVCWFEELDRERKWNRDKMQKLLAEVSELRRDQLISSHTIGAIEKRLNVTSETLNKLTKSPAAKQQESKSASTAALSEIIGG